MRKDFSELVNLKPHRTAIDATELDFENVQCMRCLLAIPLTWDECADVAAPTVRQSETEVVARTSAPCRFDKNLHVQFFLYF